MAMSLEDVKALTFDTGGTVLDWHTGFSDALTKVGSKYGLEKDWPGLANDLRRRSLGLTVKMGEHAPPERNHDDSHRIILDEIISENGLDAFTDEDRRLIAWQTPHNLDAWPDFPAVLTRLRERYICASFTILSYRMIIDTAKKNGLSWDAVLSCEGIGKYKTLPESYLTAAKWLQLEPGEICMVACHNFDLDAAKKAGFKTAFVRRPDEWGAQGPPDPEPNPDHDIIADNFPDLARQLGVQVF
jgi:2-haloacid dehalogenase